MEGSDILVKGFADEKSAENYYDSGRNTSQIIAAVIFHSLYSNYTIRTDFYITPSPYRYISAVRKLCLLPYHNRELRFCIR